MVTKMDQTVRHLLGLSEQPFWRISRWIFPLFWFFTSIYFTQVPINPSNNLLATILILLVLPEIANLITFKKRYHKVFFITLLCDTCLTVILCLSVNSDYRLLFFLLIPLTIDIRDWRLPFATTVLAIIINTGLFLFRNQMEISPLNLIFNNLLLGIICIVSIKSGSNLKLDDQQIRDMQIKLDTHSDHYLMRAHEIRTPLTLIQASVELVLDGAPGPLTDKQREFLEDVEENSRYIQILTENMLTRGKLESGVFKPTFETIDLRNVILPVVTDMCSLAERRKQKICTYYPQILPNILGDPILLRQTFTNLILNAIRHTSNEERIIINLAVNDLALTVTITDDGAGMSAKQRQQLFKRFATDGKGTGLGMAIVKQSVELHGGRIFVDTSLGRGTTFLLTFPFNTAVEGRKNG